MKLMITVFASIALAILSLSIPAPVFTTQASADRMNGKGNCSGGVCTGGGTAWRPYSPPPKTTKVTKVKKTS
jgi:hypothetical protein